MKGMFAKQGFRTLMAMFFVAFAMLVTAERASAQSLTGGATTGIVFADKQTAWKDNAAAIDILKDAMANDWVPILDNSPNNTNALRHVLYYKAIIVELMNGENVGLALVKTLPQAGRLGTDAEIPGTTKVVLQSLYDEASGLLVK